jgi:hypothetical protein
MQGPLTSTVSVLTSGQFCRCAVSRPPGWCTARWNLNRAPYLRSVRMSPQIEEFTAEAILSHPPISHLNHCRLPRTTARITAVGKAAGVDDDARKFVES